MIIGRFFQILHCIKIIYIDVISVINFKHLVFVVKLHNVGNILQLQGNYNKKKQLLPMYIANKKIFRH